MDTNGLLAQILPFAKRDVYAIELPRPAVEAVDSDA
jgi:hypothetical protein